MVGQSIKSKAVKYILGENDYVIPIVYPDYLVSIPKYETTLFGKKISIKPDKKEFGHAGVLLINEENGTTKYYEYGRYEENGIIRKVSIPDVIIDGRNVTKESLKKVLNKISNQSGQHGRIEATIHRGDYYEKSLEWITKNNTTYRGNTKENYSILDHNCMSFTLDLLAYLKIETHWAGFAIIPYEEIEELQNDFIDLRFNPKNNLLEIEEIYNVEN